MKRDQDWQNETFLLARVLSSDFFFGCRALSVPCIYFVCVCVRMCMRWASVLGFGFNPNLTHRGNTATVYRWWCFGNRYVLRVRDAHNECVFPANKLLHYTQNTNSNMDRLCTRSWLSSKYPQTAHRPMTIIWGYFHTSFCTSRRDGLKL